MPRAKHDAPGLAEARAERAARRAGDTTPAEDAADPVNGAADAAEAAGTARADAPPKTSTSKKKTASAKPAKRTPAMQQYDRFKRSHPGCVLFFRMGDFYEMFDDDAVTCHRALGITLTRRQGGTPMAGVPHHALEGYLRRMVEQGFRVAVADQIQDPKDAKGVVDRAVTRVLTPGTLVDESLLDESAPNVVAAVHLPGSMGRVGSGGGARRAASEGLALRPTGAAAGGAATGGAATGGAAADGTDAAASDAATRAIIAAAEVSTGRFTLMTVPVARVADELARLGPSEVIHAEEVLETAPPALAQAFESLGVARSPRPAWTFDDRDARRCLQDHFGVSTLAGWGFDDGDPAPAAAGALLRYLQETQAPDDLDDGGTRRRPTTGPAGGRLAHLTPPRRIDPARGLVLDQASLASLEIERTMRRGTTDGSLLSTLQRATTPMGKRLLREWLCYPLADLDAIVARQAAVAALLADGRARRELQDAIKPVQDVARIAARIAMGRATPRDLVALGTSVGCLDELVERTEGIPALTDRRARLAALSDAIGPLAADVRARCLPDPPAHLREGGLFCDGIDDELDEARTLQRDAAGWLAQYQADLSERTGIPSLKVGFNKVFGYYIELTHAHSSKAPPDFHRKQTLKNAERYITPELKTFEEKVTTAEARAVEREQTLFAELCTAAAARTADLSAFAEAVAELDVLLAFSVIAGQAGWCRPEMTDEPVVEITGGRHPVLDRILGDGFVPNDCHLGRSPRDDGPDASLALITGPNMAGKSTYIRQVALLTLLAHTGCWVPADAATIGLTDRIFTRIGASDELHAGQSTFMVEMVETASILHHATERSLVVLDEIGRGTSTLDGLALAWAIAETMAASGGRTLFATHYHELTDLADTDERVTNLHVTVREWEGDVIFLHRIARGRAGQSYGIHVARIAGVPAPTVARANTLLESLAVHHAGNAAAGAVAPGPRTDAPETASDDAAEHRSTPDEAARSAPPPAPGRRSSPQLDLFAAEAAPHPVVDALREIELDRMTPLDAFDLLRQYRAMVRGDDGAPAAGPAAGPADGSTTSRLSAASAATDAPGVRGGADTDDTTGDRGDA